jgi:hypothetical protein
VSPSPTKAPAKAKDTAGAPVEVENQAADPDELAVDKAEQQAGIASAMGGSDQYAYADKTAIPVHERTMQMNSTTEASQAELNPAFTPKPEDGGPVHPVSGEGVGTEPNMAEKLAIAEDEASK